MEKESRSCGDEVTDGGDGGSEGGDYYDIKSRYGNVGEVLRTKVKKK